MLREARNWDACQEAHPPLHVFFTVLWASFRAYMATNNIESNRVAWESLSVELPDTKQELLVVSGECLFTLFLGSSRAVGLGQKVPTDVQG